MALVEFANRKEVESPIGSAGVAVKSFLLVRESIFEERYDKFAEIRRSRDPHEPAGEHWIRIWGHPLEGTITGPAGREEK